MQAYEVLRTILKAEKLSSIDISLKLGRTRSYVSAIISRKSNPNTTIMALILDAMGYDLVARHKSGNGPDYVIDIPEEDSQKQLLESLAKAYELDEF